MSAQKKSSAGFWAGVTLGSLLAARLLYLGLLGPVYFLYLSGAISEDVDSMAFFCDLFFDDAFGNLDCSQQQGYFSESLNAAIDALEAKFRQRRIEYDFQRLRFYVQLALKSWKRSKGRQRSP